MAPGARNVPRDVGSRNPTAGLNDLNRHREVWRLIGCYARRVSVAAELSERAQAFWTVEAGRGELRAAPVDAPAAGEVLVHTRFSAISRGSESLVFRGLVPRSQWSRMRGPHQQGEFGFPVKYGYCTVGDVVAGEGPRRAVFCLHPHQSAFTVDAAAVVDVPAAVPPARAVLAANMETALGGVWDGRVGPGDRVVVVGGGVVGCLVGYLCARIPGCSVQLIDLDPRKREAGQALGLQFAEPSGAWTGADVVFHASASGAGLQRALDSAGEQATVVEMSWYGDREVGVRLGGGFHPQRIRLISSQVGSLPPHQAARWTFRRRMELALSLLADDALDVLFSGESRFEDLPTVMAELSAADSSAASAPVFCHRIRYR